MIPFDLSAETLLVVALIYVLAGLVKGVIGIGLPLVSIPLLVQFMPLHPLTAICFLVLPTYVVNIWQARQSGYLGGAVKRFWPALLTLTIGMPIGLWLVARLTVPTLLMVIGALIVLAAISQIVTYRLRISAGHERWATPLVGFGSGFLGGISSFFGPPFTLYIVMLEMSKDEFVGTVAVYYMYASIPLYVGLWLHGYLTWGTVIVSVFATVFILAGAALGQWLRERVSQLWFRRIVLLCLLVVGINMMLKGLES